MNSVKIFKIPLVMAKIPCGTDGRMVSGGMLLVLMSSASSSIPLLAAVRYARVCCPQFCKETYQIVIIK